MSPQASQIAQELLQSAIGSGPVEMPAAVQQMLQELPSHAAQSLPLNTMDLTQQVAEQFPTWQTLVSGKTLEPEQAERWVNALRWVLQELRTWTPELAQPWLRLQLLLAALAAFDVVNVGVDDTVLQQFIAPPLPEGLRKLLEQAGAQQVRPHAGTNSWRDDVQAAGRDGDYERLELLTRRLNARLQPDSRLAIYLIWRIQPDLLAGLINQKSDAILSCAVCEVLADSAPTFALVVDDVTFKFLSIAAVADVQPERAPSGAVEVFCELLLQVASSPHWRSWMQAYYKHPKGNRVSEQALSKSLGQLGVGHWADFVSAVQLWTHRGTVAPVANILILFYQTVGDPGAREMWLLAFRRWDQWDYGREEKNSYMFAPAACSFDFPVTMHYAHLPPEEVKVEEERLVEAIASVEQEWFSSESDLVTHRNRLLSRLRLVHHGQALASGATEALPPPVQSDGEYAMLRYRYYDVNSPM